MKIGTIEIQCVVRSRTQPIQLTMAGRTSDAFNTCLHLVSVCQLTPVRSKISHPIISTYTALSQGTRRQTSDYHRVSRKTRGREERLSKRSPRGGQLFNLNQHALPAQRYLTDTVWLIFTLLLFRQHPCSVRIRHLPSGS
jgi:hypothetical protein